MANTIFGGEDKKHTQEFQSKVDTHSKTLVAVTQRQKDIEGALQTVSEKVDMLDHNTVKDVKEIHSELKSLQEELTSIQSELKKVKEYNEKISKQLKLFATKDDVAKLEKYIDLWEPLNFVTRDEHEQGKKEIIEKITKVIEKSLEEDSSEHTKK